jgi:putative transposase
MNFRKQNHCVYYANYHIVLVTKYRRKILKNGMGIYLVEKLKGVSKLYPDLAIIEANTDKDHIHIMMSIPPKIAVSKVINIIKSNTGRAMRNKFPFLNKVYWDEDGIWSDGYFVSTVGVNENIIKKYIERQGVEDSGQAKLEFV